MSDQRLRKEVAVRARLHLEQVPVAGQEQQATVPRVERHVDRVPYRRRDACRPAAIRERDQLERGERDDLGGRRPGAARRRVNHVERVVRRRERQTRRRAKAGRLLLEQADLLRLGSEAGQASGVGLRGRGGGKKEDEACQDGSRQEGCPGPQSLGLECAAALSHDAPIGLGRPTVAPSRRESRSAMVTQRKSRSSDSQRDSVLSRFR